MDHEAGAPAHPLRDAMTPGLIVFTALWLIVIGFIIRHMRRVGREDRARRNRGTDGPVIYPSGINTPDTSQIGCKVPPNASDQEQGDDPQCETLTELEEPCEPDSRS